MPDHPDPPLRVYVRIDYQPADEWIVIYPELRGIGYGMNGYGATVGLPCVTVIDHPANDPAAVRLIEASKGKKMRIVPNAPPTNTASDLLTDSDDWGEVESMGPNAQDLIKLSQEFPAPDDWD